jgi:hypothetical protein
VLFGGVFARRVVMRLPIWSAYFIAPAVLLGIAWKVIVRSESPVALVAMLVGCGLFCATVMHAVEAWRKRRRGE